MKAIILAAGLGSRLAKLTKNNHKSLIKVGKQSILERLINQFEICGIKKINIIDKTIITPNSSDITEII